MILRTHRYPVYANGESNGSERHASRVVSAEIIFASPAPISAAVWLISDLRLLDRGVVAAGLAQAAAALETP
jgi:hypothetical protein